MIYMKLTIMFIAMMALIAVPAYADVVSTLDSVVVPDGNLTLVDEKEMATDNGLQLLLGHVSNNANFAVLAENITFGGKVIPIGVVIQPNSTWTYARINGILIVPKTPAVIDTEKTSFYRTGKQLHVSFDATDEVDIYFKEHIAPQIVVADSSIKWGFEEGRLNIMSSDLMKEINVYWTNDENSTVMILDKRKTESLEYKISMLVQEIPKLTEIVIKLRERNNDLKSVLFSLESRIKSLQGENDKMSATLMQANRSTSEMENRISGNVVLNQSAFAVAVIIAIISAMVLFDAIFLRKKGVKNE